MNIVLWDTRKLDVSKDFAGGFGVGNYPQGPGLRNKIIRYFYTRDRRPVALLFAYLAAIMRQLGHQVVYAEDHVPRDADVYLFAPSLITLDIERQAMARVLRQNPTARVLVVGLVASVVPEAFDELDVTVVKGEAEQLLWCLDDVLAKPSARVQLGSIEDLDRLPLPDWSLFRPQRFRIGYDFWRFPTALIQASRGCTFRCNYCPYIILENTTRFRDPEAVVEEMHRGMRTWGFRSFKFRDPLFGLDRKRMFRLAELIGQLPKKVQFSIETRIDLVPPEVLRTLKGVGLTSITVGLETPDSDTLRQYHRSPIRDDKQEQFIATCRELGIRTVAGFMIGFPEDTEDSVMRVMSYARLACPTYANFNIVTPYPGTEFFEQVKDQIADTDFSHYTVYTPVLRYEHMTAQRMAELHAKCFQRFYFRWPYLKANAHLLWPWLRRFGVGRTHATVASGGHPGVPQPHATAEVLRRKGLREDGPHQGPGASGQTSDRHPTE